MEDEGWQVAVLKEIPPVKPDWPSEWKSVRHHLGISAFGINAVSNRAGEIVAVEPQVKRSFVARVTPTTLLIVGSPVGAAYELPGWEQ